jgi:putative ABC transport system substrate-binding protein
MHRRKFLYGLGSTVFAPICARAQQRPARIGLLSSTSAAPYKPLAEAIATGLREKGFVEGRSLTIEHRWVDGNYERLAGLAKDLVASQVNAIIAVAPPAARAAKAATKSIPVVFSTSGDPVALGLVPNLNRPGENLTGVNLMLFAMGPKRLDLLIKLVPKAARIGLLVNPNNPSTARSIIDSEAAARSMSRSLIVVRAGNEREIEAAFDSLREQNVAALSVEADPYLLARRDQLAARAARERLPAIYPHRENAEAGGLISYGTDLTDAYRQIGIYTARILNGEHPGNLPVMQITKFETVINMKAAQAIDLKIPPDLLTLADHLIE